MAHSPPPVSPVAAAGRAAWAALEPMHNLLYFDPVAEAEYVALGISDRRWSYFAQRACALGPVGADVVQALFYNFSPAGVGVAIPKIWSIVSPQTLVETRFDVADKCLRPLLGDSIGSPEMLEAVSLARRAAEAATEHVRGRALFAAHAAMPWPDQPHVQLWWAQTLLREFRGDGHQSTLLHSGLTGIEALAMYASTEKVDGDQLRATRGWHSGEWRAVKDELRSRGLLTGSDVPEPTAEGRQLREWIENTTDNLALPAYSVLGADGCQRLAELSARLNEPVVAADVIPWLKKFRPQSRRSRARAVAMSRTDS